MENILKTLDHAMAMIDMEREDGNGGRALSIALTHIETASMWIEKAASEAKDSEENT